MKKAAFASKSPAQPVGSSQSLGAWLNALAVLQPPARIVHVGMSATPDEAAVWLHWPLSKALIIGAEPVAVDQLKATAVSPEVIEAQSQVIADTEGLVEFYEASNPSESGLVDPNFLRMVWSSLTLSKRSQREATTLDHAAAAFISTPVHPVSEPQWLVVDCLPAIRILSGGQHLLESTSLVCVRVIAEAGFRGEPSGADLVSVDQWLAEHGFKRAAYIHALNPKIGHAVYGRTQSVAATRAAAQAEAAKKQTLDTLHQDLSNTRAERETLQTRSSKLETQLKTAVAQH
ncbi:hypothetical protein, partial [Zwartia sp.]|uniref:hypothetical protein n=1 Tax=Zwartia sp. TaxID=2978004 RepID=UPI00271AB5D2